MPPHSFAPPDGTHPSLTNAISRNGTPEPGRRYTVAARSGVAVRLDKGQRLTIVNLSGHQVCDLFAFLSENLSEHLSMPHLHTSLGSIFPKPGDRLVSNLRRPLLTITEDSSPGVHDTIVACCDRARYRELGCEGYHDNCADNLSMALQAIGEAAPLIPAPFNVWMNVPVAPDGRTRFEPPVARPGDRITLRAETGVIAVMSACPQDMTPVNGVGVAPGPLEFRVADA